MPAAPASIHFAPLGDSALQLEFGSGIDAALNARIHACAERLRAAALPGVQDLVPGYTTLTVHYDPWACSTESAGPYEALRARVASLLEGDADLAAPAPRTLEIPVRYGGADGPDLAEVARHTGLSAAEVIARHSAGLYRVFMVGFTPGFPYLGGMDPALAAPRRAEPRLRVPAGSVGIAGTQTGIYPLASPGGWQLIGRTEAVLFDPLAAEPCLLRPGDLLRFVAMGGGE